ncbi:hypothetical protein CASFOL_016593 [Castilleja foliolosa]|uniref:Uncharacterized protein n=1 Tax=Castilleja foliolosa TaxID=1961234 RepID=A0ABD3DAR5_9LAMI
MLWILPTGLRGRGRLSADVGEVSGDGVDGERPVNGGWARGISGGGLGWRRGAGYWATRC